LLGSGLEDEHLVRLYGAQAEEVTASWNSGAWLLGYAGHGSLDRWGKEDVLSVESIAGLQAAETAPPIVLQLTCLTGYFAHPEIASISERLLLHPAGPVLLIAATSLTLSSSQQPFGINFLRELQDPDVARIGDALQRAKLALDTGSSDSMREISDTYGLLGDPSALIRRPRTADLSS
jgi:hypothetical protein